MWGRVPDLGRIGLGALLCVAAGCASVGPDFSTPEAPVAPAWQELRYAGFEAGPAETVDWWQVFDDPVLDSLVARAYAQNLSLQVAGLRVLEARAQLGIATGARYPQVQTLSASAIAIGASEANANTAGGGDLRFGQYDLGADVVWEADFWGRFRRGIESADAALATSIAAYDDGLVVLTAQVAETYLVIRTLEEQLRIARANVELQQRSFDITEVNFRNGSESGLDMQQALSLLRGTQASIPDLELSLNQAHNALSFLLGQPPGGINALLGGEGSLPELPEGLAVGVPADLLRRRPDVRAAEYSAAAQSALIGVAKADLYPSFVLAGSIGVAAGESTNTTRTGSDGLGELFSSDALTYSFGPVFTWNVLNYGRIKNNVRVQDARLQQALLGYENAVLNASREVEDAMVAYRKRKEQNRFLQEAVDASTRASELSLLRYREGLASYQRVLDAQQALARQQRQLAANQGDSVRSVVALYKALGGGWQHRGAEFVAPDVRTTMQERTDWGRLLEEGAVTPEDAVPDDSAQGPDW